MPLVRPVLLHCYYIPLFLPVLLRRSRLQPVVHFSVGRVISSAKIPSKNPSSAINHIKYLFIALDGHYVNKDKDPRSGMNSEAVGKCTALTDDVRGGGEGGRGRALREHSKYIPYIGREV